MADKGQPLFCRIDNAVLIALSLDGQQKAPGLLLCHRPESLAVSKLQRRVQQGACAGTVASRQWSAALEQTPQKQTPADALLCVSK